MNGSFSLSGANETYTIALASDLVSNGDNFENSVEALVSWSYNSDFPFQRLAGWLAEEAVSDERLHNIGDWYESNKMK